MADTTQTAAKLDVRAYPIAEPKGSTVAFASVTINDLVAINGIKVVNGEKGLFASMPQTKDTNGDYRDIAFPVTKELRQQLNKAILDEYAAVKDQPASVKDQIRDGAKAAKDAPTTEAPAAAKTAKKTGPEH